MKSCHRYFAAGLRLGLETMLGFAALSTAVMASGPPPGYTRIEQDAAAVSYTGSWNNESSPAYSGGSAVASIDTGAEAQLKFSGTAVQWVGFSGPSTGMAQVFVDGIQVTTVNTESKQNTPQAVLYAVSGLTPAAHTLTIRVMKPGKGRQPGGIWIDAFNVLPLSSDTTPPTATLTAPQNGSTVSGTVSVSADASDNVGVTSVQFELDNAPLGPALTAPPYTINWDTTSVANGAHTLAAVARDAAGNIGSSQTVSVTVSNSSSTTRIEQDNPAVSYTGTWYTASDPTVSGGTATESTQPGATATLTFNGTQVSWIGYRCSCAAGIATVSVDGSAPVQVDTYSAVTQPQAVVYTSPALPAGTHTLSITVTGEYDRAGNTAYVVVDAFDVTN